MSNDKTVNSKQRGFEKFILLVLGEHDVTLSLLHLEKETFLLRNFYPDLKDYMNFLSHYRGPFSREVEETIKNPAYLENLWVYYPPKSGDKLSGGHIRLTDKGRREYKNLYEKVKNDERLKHLLSGIKMVRNLYDSLSKEELLLLIYDTYPEYVEKSIVYNDIESKKGKLANKLRKRGVIDEERYENLIEE